MHHPLRVCWLCCLTWLVVACSPGAPVPLEWSQARGTPLRAWPALDAASVGQWGAAAGRPAVATLWARWCAPCLEEMPALAVLAERTGVRWVALATDDPEDRPEGTLAALAPVGAGLAHGRAEGGPEAFLRSAAAAWGGMLPVHALFGPDGRPLGVIEGVLTEEDEARLVRRLAGAPEGKGEP